MLKNSNGCICGHCCCDECSCVSHYHCSCDKCGWNGSHGDEAWPEEIEAIEDIKTGKTNMETVTGEEFLKELDQVNNDNS